jgi:hypothetical protein
VASCLATYVASRTALVVPQGAWLGEWGAAHLRVPSP